MWMRIPLSFFSYKLCANILKEKEKRERIYVWKNASVLTFSRIVAERKDEGPNKLGYRLGRNRRGPDGKAQCLAVAVANPHTKRRWSKPPWYSNTTFALRKSIIKKQQHQILLAWHLALSRLFSFYVSRKQHKASVSNPQIISIIYPFFGWGDCAEGRGVIWEEEKWSWRR